MGLSLLSALQIQGNETLVDTYQDKESGKYGYAIIHNEDKYCRPIVSCNPAYDSREDALKAGTELMGQVKKLDLSPQGKSLVDIIGGEETAKTVESIVQASIKNIKSPLDNL
ncbi:hypothetical protein K8R30_01590 [archaeon]|nr:hypothetical protein [archaeon]